MSEDSGFHHYDTRSSKFRPLFIAYIRRGLHLNIWQGCRDFLKTLARILVWTRREHSSRTNPTTKPTMSLAQKITSCQTMTVRARWISRGCPWRAPPRPSLRPLYPRRLPRARRLLRIRRLLQARPLLRVERPSLSLERCLERRVIEGEPPTSLLLSPTMHWGHSHASSIDLLETRSEALRMRCVERMGPCVNWTWSTCSSR